MALRLVMDDRAYMELALIEAKKAAALDEVPVGAVVVRNGAVIASAHNEVEARNDATAHAEILALRRASETVGDWRLSDCTLYVTLEPCCMCAGAMVNARLKRVVFGAFDEALGCCVSAIELTNNVFSHTVETVGGVCEADCAAVLSAYFKKKR